MGRNGENLALMDRVHAELFAKKTAYGLPVKAAAAAIMVDYRKLLRKAQRFVVDEESVRLVTRLNAERERLSAWAFLARTPYDTIWIEFDIRFKVDEATKMGIGKAVDDDEMPSRVGFLMTRDEPTGDSPRWVAHEFVEFQIGAGTGSLAIGG